MLLCHERAPHDEESNGTPSCEAATEASSCGHKALNTSLGYQQGFSTSKLAVVDVLVCHKMQCQLTPRQARVSASPRPHSSLRSTIRELRAPGLGSQVCFVHCSKRMQKALRPRRLSLTAEATQTAPSREQEHTSQGRSVSACDLLQGPQHRDRLNKT